ncbi:hypothetical protein RH915_03600, partial [Serpentinicella sp. ANB-PHB4]|nr:hypothetical protein [Serpentinicella sp. ANB-PHB4]
MNFNQNNKINQVKEETMVIGVDIGSEIHYARAFDWRGIELDKVFKFHNSEEGFDRFYTWLEKIKNRASYYILFPACFNYCIHVLHLLKPVSPNIG